MAAADGLIWGALSAAGEKLRKTPACPRSERARARDIDSARLHTLLTVDAAQVEQWRLLDGAWSRAPEIATRYGVDPDCLTASLDGYARELIAAGVEHEYRLVPTVLTSCPGLPHEPARPAGRLRPRHQRAVLHPGCAHRLVPGLPGLDRHRGPLLLTPTGVSTPACGPGANPNTRAARFHDAPCYACGPRGRPAGPLPFRAPRLRLVRPLQGPRPRRGGRGLAVAGAPSSSDRTGQAGRATASTCTAADHRRVPGVRRAAVERRHGARAHRRRASRPAGGWAYCTGCEATPHPTMEAPWLTGPARSPGRGRLRRRGRPGPDRDRRRLRRRRTARHGAGRRPLLGGPIARMWGGRVHGLVPRLLGTAETAAEAAAEDAGGQLPDGWDDLPGRYDDGRPLPDGIASTSRSPSTCCARSATAWPTPPAGNWPRVSTPARTSSSYGPGCAPRSPARARSSARA